MEERISVVVAGGDLRQVYAANALAQRGFSVTAVGFSGREPWKKVCCSEELTCLETTQLLLLPLTVSKGGRLNAPLCAAAILLEDCFKSLPANCHIFGGNVTEEERKLAESYGLEIHDYFKVEELTVANAVLTAEAAIQLTMEQSPRALWRSKALICGGGRIARALIPRLKVFGIDVTLAARKPEQRIWAAAEGVETISLAALPSILPEQQLIFNTIPCPLLKEAELQRCSSDCLLMELASKPYGIDRDAAQRLNRKVILASGLPGKHSPQTAGELVASTVLNMRKG